MRRHSHLPERLASNLSVSLLVTLLIILWIAGGASRADVAGQVVTRSLAWLIAIVFILFGPLPRWRPVAPAALLLIAAIILVGLHLIPLPPSLWLDLPGRGLFAEAASVIGQEQPWRPLSVSPDATMNALSSLVVPVVTLLLIAGLTLAQHLRIVTLLLGLILASSLFGLLQFSGTRLDHPFVNDVYGAVSANFANRNHFALFAAIGCLLAPAWAFADDHRPGWKGPVAIGLLLFFALIILASGSRTGMVVGVLGIAIGLTIVRRRITAQLNQLPKRTAIALLGASMGVLVFAVLLSMNLNRAVSIDRALVMDVSDDLRARALPTVLAMIEKYFPYGSGFGAFDPTYRIAEPDSLLSIAYFNHAHNDPLEVVLDGGLPALLLLGAALLWWLWKSVAAWRTKDRSDGILPRLGSAVLLLVLIASLTDYPARTPMIMAVIMIAATWLNNRMQGSDMAARQDGTEPNGAAGEARLSVAR